MGCGELRWERGGGGGWGSRWGEEEGGGGGGGGGGRAGLTTGKAERWRFTGG